MPRFDIPFTVSGETQTITATQNLAIRAGSKNYWFATFTFTDNIFEGLEYLSATFSTEPYARSKGRAKIVPIENNQCQVPWEVLTRKGKVYVGIFAGDMLVTNEATFEVTYSAPTLGNESQPTESWYARFETALDAKQDALTAGDGITIDGNVISATGGGIAYVTVNSPFSDIKEAVDAGKPVVLVIEEYGRYIPLSYYSYDDPAGEAMFMGQLPGDYSQDVYTCRLASGNTQWSYQVYADKSVKFESQTLTAQEKAQARANINAQAAEQGKGLSSNDYDAAAKAKVDAIPENPKYTDTVYDDSAIVDRVSAIEGKESTWDAKADDEDIPTKVSDLTNDSGFITNTATAYRSASIPMGECDGTSTATAFTATVPGITELRDGVCVWLRNNVVTSASGFTIDINGLGAKPVYSSLAAATRVTTTFNVNYTELLVYNESRVTGGCWDMVYGVDTNTTYTPAKLGFGYAVCDTAEATLAKTASISSYALTANALVSIKFTHAVPANATLNITSKGAKAIYYRGAPITAGVIKAGDTVTLMYSTYYHVIAIDRDKQDKVATVTVSDSGAVTQALDAGTVYQFTGALTSLTISFNATSDLPQYHFIFTTGSTAFDPVLPNGVVLPDGHTWEANKRYEVDILDGYAVVASWAVSA